VLQHPKAPEILDDKDNDDDENPVRSFFEPSVMPGELLTGVVPFLP
jgi:hypothetical protein